MDPGVTARAVLHTSSAAGEPAVFPVRRVGLIQPDLQALDEPVLVPDGDQKAVWPGKGPLAVPGIEAGDAQKFMTAAHQFCQKPALRRRLRHGAVAVSLDPLLAQPALQKVFPVPFGERQER